MEFDVIRSWKHTIAGQLLYFILPIDTQQRFYDSGETAMTACVYVFSK